jgi:hypothetical protein
MQEIPGAVLLRGTKVPPLRKPRATYRRGNITLIVCDSPHDEGDVIIVCSNSKDPQNYTYYLVAGWTFADYVIDQEFTLVSYLTKLKRGELGFKGKTTMHKGYAYAPYIPLFTSP